MTHRRRLFALAVVAGLLLSGCGQEMYAGPEATDEPRAATSPTPAVVRSPDDASSPSARSVSAVTRAGEAARDAGSSRLAMTIEASGGGRSFSLDAEGLFDYRTGVGRMEMTVPGLAEPVQQIVTPDAIYLRTSVPGAPSGWVKADARGFAGATGGGVGGNDPATALVALEGASDDVTRQGTGVVRGVRTTRYVGTIDVRRALAEAPEQQRARVAEALGQVRVSEVPFEAYVDGDGLLRRLVQTMSMEVPGAGAVDMTVTLDLYDFGVNVQVSPPPPGQVIDGTTLGTSPGG